MFYIATKMFQTFVEKDFCGENLSFWLSVREFKNKYLKLFDLFKATAATSKPSNFDEFFNTVKAIGKGSELQEMHSAAKTIYDKFIPYGVHYSIMISDDSSF